METGQEKARYSRADLLALRYEGNARQRPSCSNQTELQTLGFWKNGVLSGGGGGSGCGISSSSYGNSCLSPETDNSSLSSSNNGLNSSRRALRNRERANTYYQRFAPNDSQLGCEDRERDRDRDRERERDTQSANNILTPSFKSSSIDHRSISSSHLMPAFAKRRFAAAAESNELTTNNANSDDFLSGVERNGTPTLLNKESKRNSLVSPVPKGSGGCDNEHSLASSPTYSSARHERRIGSGRLLPRSDNWEFKKQETDTDSAVVEREKDRERPHNGSMLQNSNQQSQRTFSGRQNDREFCGDRDQRRSQYEGKRPLDRPTGVGNTTGSGAVGGLGGRRTSNKDKFSFNDVGRGKRGSVYHQMQDRHHKEPEWFSAGPTSQLETIDLHGFDDLENSNESRTSDSKKERVTNALPIDTDTQLDQETMSKNSSSGSLNLLESKTSDDLKDVDMNTQEAGNFTLSQKESEQLTKHQHPANPEMEFNFDAFLSLDPMDNSLIGNDADMPGAEIGGFGKSRFSRWFGPNESTKNNNEESPKIREANTPDIHGIPSVKDLEAQMTKVDLHTAMAMPPQSVSHVEKPVARDTEAFKKLLQQLGAQNMQQGHEQDAATDLFQMMRAPNAIPRNAHQLNHPHLIDAHQNFAVRTDEDVHQFLQQQQHQQQRLKLSEGLPPNRIVESVAPQQHNSVHGPTPNIHVQTQKRMEIQHLVQSIFRGDISLEFLEKELINPNTTAHTKDVIAAVFRECSNARRNSMPPKQTYQNDVIGGHSNINTAHPSYHQTLGPNISEELFTPNLPSNPNMNHHIRHSNSPTPLAFTPTSVLRKMTADKDTPPLHNSPGNQQQQKHQQYHQYQAQVTKPIASHHMLMESQQMPAINLQPRMILGGGGTYAPNPNSPQVSPKLLPHPRNQQQPQPQQIKWPTGNIQAPHTIKSFGRPILKGTLNSAPVQQAAQPVAAFASKIELQRLSEGISQIPQHHQFVQQAQSRQTARQPRQMAHMDLHRQHNQPGPSDSSECVNVIQNNGLGAINYHRDDRLPSTTNQLAQWFSPELLAKASAGKLPLLNMNQALSLEEFERRIQHSSATVHN
ncbi:eukaryotic translation initiation factor 4E transporter [Drosophila tropicalis]|uniref:eukaryotic translation initiation factor 4E transporter n=1 Tax=Drosophila tropicalis TaxID=46794 RepID=UPI0035ABE084